MKRTCGYGYLVMVLPLTLQAQITVTNGVFPVVGDTLHYAFGNQLDAAAAVYTPPGGDQNWDLSGLQADTVWQQVFKDPAMGFGSADFPGADLLTVPFVADPNREDYVNVTPAVVEYMGSFGDDPLGIGMDLTTHWLPAMPDQRAPLNFFDIYQASSSCMVAFLPGLMPPGTVDQLPAQPDSLRIRGSLQRLDVVDAWGTLTIPGGSYPVLRMKRTEYREYRIDGKIQPLGWLDLSDQPAFLGIAALTVDTTLSFHFINDQSKETIAICTFNDPVNAVTQVQYKVADFTTPAWSGRSMGISLRVFPDPATDHITVQASGLADGTYLLIITDATGRLVKSVRAIPAGERLNQELDLQGLEAGAYQVSIVQENGLSTGFRFIKQ